MKRTYWDSSVNNKGFEQLEQGAKGSRIQGSKGMKKTD